MGVGLIGGKLGGGDGGDGLGGRDFGGYVLFGGLTGFTGQFNGFALGGAADLAWGHEICPFRNGNSPRRRVESLRASLTKK